MSARTPFVPDGGLSTPQFVADPSNPLNGGLLTQNAPENPDGLRPLNIGSLTKSNRSQNLPAARRPSLQAAAAQIPRPATSEPRNRTVQATGHPARPGTSDPHTKSKPSIVPNHRLQAHLAATHGVIAPTPVQGRLAPSIFSSSSAASFPAFKTPALPVSRASPHHDDQNDPYHSHDDPSFSESPSFRLTMLPTQPGPHRIVFGARQVTDLTQDEGDVYEVLEPEDAGQSRNRTKRRRSEVDKEDQEELYGAPAKRFKAHEEVAERRETDENAYSDGNDVYARHSLSPHEVFDYAQQHHHQQPALRHHHPRSGPHHVHNVPMPTTTTHIANPQHGADIARLMQLFKADDLNLDLDARMEKYARLSEKWKTCTREEWLAGADELATNYVKIFDFVKSHMTKKLELFVTCDGRLKQQNELLKERDGLLETVRSRLVAEGGNVLG